MSNKYCFVLDYDGKPLSPTKENKGWFLIRKGRATLEKKYPMTIRLTKRIEDKDLDKSKMHVGIDDGSKHVGLSIVQEGKTKNKVVFKSTIELRRDVKKKIDIRRTYRQYRRYHKRHRPQRYFNRANVRKKGILRPSTRQRKQSVLRVVRELNKYIRINQIHLEDVKIDVKSLVVGYSTKHPYYHTYNSVGYSLKEKALNRDNNTCVVCKDTKSKKEVHHIIPKRLQGLDTLDNVVTLCKTCHIKVTNSEEKYIQFFYNKIGVKTIPFLRDATNTMVGKSYLQKGLMEVAELNITNGSKTHNDRGEVVKSHSNDAVFICGLYINKGLYIQEYVLKPIRRKSKKLYTNVKGIKHKDIVQYTPKTGGKYVGYVIGLRPARNSIQLQTPEKRFDGISANSCAVLWSFSNIYWFNK